MSLDIQKAVWGTQTRMRANCRLVLLKLADHANAQGVCWPSVQYLAETTGMSTRTVIRSIASLREAGLVIVEANKSPRNHRANRYRICLERIGAARPGEGSCAWNNSSTDNLSRKLNSSSVNLSPSHVTQATASGDKRDHPPAPPIRKNHQEPSTRPDQDEVGEALSLMVRADLSLRGEQVARALRSVVAEELRKGARLQDVTRNLAAKWRLFVVNRDRGRFGISGWKAENFFAGGPWQDEQRWPWRPEFRPEPKVRFVDPATVYNGPEYRRRQAGA
jgi:hypothetical protein